MSSIIGINAQFLRPGRVGGAEYMLKNLVGAINEVRGPSDELRVFCTESWHLEGPTADVRWVIEGRGNRFLQEWRAVRSQKGEVDVFLLPNYFTPPAISSVDVRLVTVIHDLKYIHFPQDFTWRKRCWLRTAHEFTLRLADRVVVISEFVRKDILKHYGAGWDEKIEVIPNPISFQRFESPKVLDEQYGAKFGTLDGRYLLSVTAQYPHKNLETLLRAFAGLHRQSEFSDISLVLTGQDRKQLIGTKEGPDLRQISSDLGIANRVLITGHVTDAELGWLYRHADFFVLPSLFEGFGMPAVEALGFGLPVLTTRCGALPEVTLGAACYVSDPKSTPEWTDLMTEMARYPARYKPSSETISAVRHRFSPSQVGKAYYDLLTG